jgi:outer membrane protein OmpA-like peptidoglycan-associated protein
MAEPDGGELAQLRELLVGPERAQLDEIQAWLDSPEKRSADLARFLPEAIKAARAKALREALEPVFEKAFESSVRKHPKDLADAIYPVMGPAIRSSIAASIREFAENLNQIVEKSASFRAIRWRIEARVTGKPFSEILLTRSLLYSVEQVFLIHRKSGLLLQHVAAKESILKDADMISGMLTAIQDFFSDSFSQEGQDLETVDTGRYKLWIQYGPKALVVGAVSGTAPAELKGVFRNAIDRIHGTLYAELDTFRQGDVSVFDPAKPFLEACLLGQSSPDRRKTPVIAWVAVAALVLLAIAFFWHRAQVQSRWDHYFADLKQQPGIVVTAIEKRDGLWMVSGLKDPKAPDPVTLTRRDGADPAAVRYQWEPFLSLNTAFAADREADAAKAEIEKQLIRFDLAGSKLPLSELRQVESVATMIGMLLRIRPGAHIVVTGRADDVGTPEVNQKLSQERAQHVLEALVVQGLPPDHLEAVSLSNLHPLRAGASEWDKATNRSVAFEVKL